MIRNILGSVIALVGATAAVFSPFRVWYGGRHGSEIRVEDLFTGLTTESAVVLGSIFLPMLVAAVLVVIAVVFRSRGLMTVAGLLVLLTVALWGVQQYRTATGLNSRLADYGIALALGGGALILIGAVVMSGRPGRGRHRAPPSVYGAGDADHDTFPERPP
jgi:hypothetical protein